MAQPKGYEVEDGSLVCKLTKALYGLKQAPRACSHKAVLCPYSSWFPAY